MIIQFNNSLQLTGGQGGRVRGRAGGRRGQLGAWGHPTGLEDEGRRAWREGEMEGMQRGGLR